MIDWAIVSWQTCNPGFHKTKGMPARARGRKALSVKLEASSTDVEVQVQVMLASAASAGAALAAKAWLKASEAQMWSIRCK